MRAGLEGISGFATRTWSDRQQSVLWILAVALPVGAIAQIHVPVGVTGITLTVSDFVVALALPLIAFAIARGWRPTVLSLVPHLPLWFGLATVALVIGFLISLSRFGFQVWATTRVLGWFMLIGHVAVAAVVASDARTRSVALWIFVVAAAVSFLPDIKFILERSVFVPLEKCGWVDDARGLTKNANAFGFVMLTAFAVLMSHARRDQFGGTIGQAALTAIILFGLVLSASRSAWIAAAAVGAFAFAFGWTRRLQLVIAVGLALGVIALLLGVLVCGTTSAVTADIGALSSMATTQAVDVSNNERFYSYRRALEMFLDHPLLGAGLGAFLNGEIARGANPLIIHSTFFWLAAETGLVGVAAFGALAVAIFWGLVTQIRRGPPDLSLDAKAALLVFASFAIMSLAQELLYQRCFWVVLALLIFRPASGVQKLQAP